MPDLTADQIQLVKELNSDPRFARICQQIETEHGNVPKYKPKSTDPVRDQADWIYRSGVADGVELVLKVLGYEY